MNIEYSGSDSRDREVFARDGFIGPFTLWEPEIMTAWWKELRRELISPRGPSQAVFDNPMNYDRHLDIQALSRLICEPAIVRRFQSLLGEDILCWRSEFFPKNAGDPGTGWHQVETYSIGETNRGMLEPTQRTPGMPIELTAWVAFTEATKANGCLRLIPGSHTRWRYDETGSMEWSAGRAENTFFGYDYSQLKLEPDWQPEDEEIADLEMKPGQFIIFTARCIHGSHPNRSRKQRMGFSIRVVPTSVRVYPGMTEFREFGQHFDLARHGCVLVAGRDQYGLNKVVTHNEWGERFGAPGPIQ